MTNNKTRKRVRKSVKNNTIYSINDYESNNGMLTTVWGPSMWHYLHTMSFNYPVNPTNDDKNHYMKFILNLKYVLPCGKCRKNFRKNLKRLPLTISQMQSRDTFSKYIYDLHELINTMLDKKSGLSYDIVRERYEHFRARCALPISKIIKTCKTRKSGKKKENGCTEPLYGEKSKCVLKIIPNDEKCDTFQMDTRCIKKKLI
jgi:hypothetical protein